MTNKLTKYEIDLLRRAGGEDIIPSHKFLPHLKLSSAHEKEILDWLTRQGYLVNGDKLTEKGRDEIEKYTGVSEPRQRMPINRIERGDIVHFRDTFGGPSLDVYQRIATKSAIYPGQGTPFGLMYAALGLAEAGEVQNKVKKAFRDDGVIEFRTIRVGPGVGRDAEYATTVNYNVLTTERREQIKKELGGVIWYVAAVCNEIGIAMSDVALANLEELCSRGERDTLRGDGDDR